MHKLKVNNFEYELTEDLQESLEKADGYASYCQENMYIVDEEGQVVAQRSWIGCKDGIEEETNPIDYGNFGYYTDWAMLK